MSRLSGACERCERNRVCCCYISGEDVVAIVVTRQYFSKARPSRNKSRAAAPSWLFVSLSPSFIPSGVGLKPCGFSPPSFSRSRSLPHRCWPSQPTARKSRSTRCASCQLKVVRLSHTLVERCSSSAQDCYQQVCSCLTVV